jgi:hypothetical protein
MHDRDLSAVAFEKYVAGTLAGFPVFWNVKKEI